MKQLIGWLGRAISATIYHSPLFVRHGIARLLAFVWFDLFRIRRKVVLANLAIAFPDMSESERVRLARTVLQQLTQLANQGAKAA